MKSILAPEKDILHPAYWGEWWKHTTRHYGKPMLRICCDCGENFLAVPPHKSYRCPLCMSKRSYQLALERKK